MFYLKIFVSYACGGEKVVNLLELELPTVGSLHVVARNQNQVLNCQAISLALKLSF